jgi:hypothetical protein
MTALLRKTAAAWKHSLQDSDLAGKAFVLWMLLLAPAIIAFTTIRSF